MHHRKRQKNIKNIITSSNNLITVNLDIDYVLYFLKTKKEKKLLNQLEPKTLK